MHSCIQHIRILTPTLQTRTRPHLQRLIYSPSRKFCIHFDTTGINAVPLTDADGNGIPDFVDSAAYYMDAAYRFAVDTLGFLSPLRDAVDSSAWDVYLVQLGRVPGFVFDGQDLGQYGWYGATFAEDVTTLPCGREVATGFIVMDNDFSSADSIGKRPTYRDTSYTALKITCYHEFHHLVQYAYGYGLRQEFYEMTSVWIEQRAFPAIDNYTEYVRRLFSSPSQYCLCCVRSVEGSYGYSIALRYLALQLGDSIIRRWWEGIARCSDAPRALDSVVAASGSDFRQLWCRMLPYLYWTGSRARDGYFPDAARLPELQPENTDPESQRYSEPSWMRSVDLCPLQFALLRVVLPSSDPGATPDTADFLATNPNIRMLTGSSPPTESYSVAVTTSSGEVLESTRYRVLRRTDANCDAVFVRSGFTTSLQQEPSPNPFRCSRDAELVLPVPSAAHIGDDATVRLLSTDGIEVFRTVAKVELNAVNRRCVRLVRTAALPCQGIYVVFVEAGGGTVVTKLAVMP